MNQHATIKDDITLSDDERQPCEVWTRVMGYPARLAEVLPLVDWIGFDVKAAFDDYEHITAVAGSGAKARASLIHVLASDIACDIRTTVHDALLDRAALVRLASDLAALGVRDHRLQPFRAAGCTNAALLGKNNC